MDHTYQNGLDIRKIPYLIVSALICGFFYGRTLECVIMCGLFMNLHELSIEDYLVHKISNRFIAAAAILGLLNAAINKSCTFSCCLISAGVSFFFVFLASALGKAITGKKLLGGGDIKLITVLGLFIRLESTLTFLLLFCMCSLAAICAAGRKSPIALGPAISTAAMVLLLTGRG